MHRINKVEALAKIYDVEEKVVQAIADNFGTGAPYIVLEAAVISSKGGDPSKDYSSESPYRSVIC